MLAWVAGRRGEERSPRPLLPLILRPSLHDDETRGVVDLRHGRALLFAGELGGRLEGDNERAQRPDLSGDGALLIAQFALEDEHISAHVGNGREYGLGERSSEKRRREGRSGDRATNTVTILGIQGEGPVHRLRGRVGRDADRQETLLRIAAADVEREVEIAAEKIVQKASRIVDGPRNQLSGVVFVDFVVENESTDQLPAQQQALVQGPLADEVGDGVSIGRLGKVPPRPRSVGRWIEERGPQALAPRKRKSQEDRVVAHVAATRVLGQTSLGSSRIRLSGSSIPVAIDQPRDRIWRVRIARQGEDRDCRQGRRSGQERLETGPERGIGACPNLFDASFVPIANQMRILARVRRRRRVLKHMHHLPEGSCCIGERLLTRHWTRKRQELEQALASHWP